MINLVKLELYKLKKSNLLKLILVFVMVIAALSTVSALSLNTNNGELLTGRIQYVESFHDISILFVCGVFASLYIGSDFSNRTMQAQISRGQCRRDLLLSKAISFILVTNMVIILYPLIGAVTATIKNGWGTQLNLKEAAYILSVTLEGIVLNIGTSSFFILFAFSFRDIAKSLCCSLAFPVLFSIIKPFLSGIPIVNIVINLITLSQIRTIGETNIKKIIMILISAIVTCFINYFLTSLIFKRAEIK